MNALVVVVVSVSQYLSLYLESSLPAISSHPWPAGPQSALRSCLSLLAPRPAPVQRQPAASPPIGWEGGGAGCDWLSQWLVVRRGEHQDSGPFSAGAPLWHKWTAVRAVKTGEERRDSWKNAGLVTTHHLLWELSEKVQSRPDLTWPDRTWQRQKRNWRRREDWEWWFVTR